MGHRLLLNVLPQQLKIITKKVSLISQRIPCQFPSSPTRASRSETLQNTSTPGRSSKGCLTESFDSSKRRV
ncbi:unnamed protein product [Calypogeia fissa]